jgi:ectoine hydroxylase-related dioxygenase (phytanoyl-CoA dioxygenase family)
MQRPLFRAICARVYGAHAPIAVYRAMVMSKPAGELGGGTPLPWHQDGGNWWALDRDPLCFVWLALTEASAENGAVEVVRGSHKRGLLSQRGHTLSAELVERLVEGCAAEDRVQVLLKPGQAFLCHNWTIHRSGTNVTGTARRGFSCNYIDARTRVLDPKPADAGDLGKAGEGFPVVFEASYAGAE